MSNILGPYYAPHHHWKHDRDYVQVLNPAWVRIHQPDALAIHEMTEAAPNANIMLRSWDIDDHNGERKQEVYADPIGAARKHMDMWAAKLEEIEAELKLNGWAYDKSKWFLGVVNEPDPAHARQVVTYSLEVIRIADERGWHLGVVVSSVGTFSKPSENNEGWVLFKVLEGPINEGGHILMVHEYWQPEGPSYGEDEGNLAWRHHSIPLNVPILIAESGANGYIYGRHSKNDDAGWRKFMTPEQFAAQVKEYIAGCDTRVVGVLLYMLDYHSSQWESFYTGPAAQQLLAIADTRPQVPSPFADKPVAVRFMRGDILRTTTTVNVRRSPGTQGKAADDVVRQLAPNSAVQLMEGPTHVDGLTWWRTENGWLAEVAPNGTALLTNKVDVPIAAPPVATNGIINPFLAEAVLQVESGDKAYASDGRLVIRLELHLLRKYFNDNNLFNTYFYHDPVQGHLDQRWRRSPNEAWQPSHLGSRDFDANQAKEWEVFGFAAKLNREAALLSISMGASQIMGFNHARIGYPSAEAMFKAFQRTYAAQIIGFFSYCISDISLFSALQRGDWAEIARRYNGQSSQVDTYVALMKDAYQRILGA